MLLILYLCSMKTNIQDKNKSGIYCIQNIVNNKVYIGKSINIYRRIKNHIGALNMNFHKHENEYLINSWNKYGRKNFKYFVLEYLEINEKLLEERELYWIKEYDSTNPLKGYNLRIDVNSKCIVSERTRKKCSERNILRFSKQEERDKVSIRSKEFWKNNPDIKIKMSKKVKDTKLKKWRFFKMNENNDILETFDSVEEIIEKNPNYKWQNIYSVCNGYKKRIYGFKWKKELKI